MDKQLEYDEQYISNILGKIKQVWLKNPTLRIGQLLCNCANYGALYYSSNEGIIKLLEKTYSINTDDENTVPNNTAHESEIQRLKKVIEQLQSEIKKPSANKGRVYIHRGDQIKSIEAMDLSGYLKDGWEKGKGHRK